MNRRTILFFSIIALLIAAGMAAYIISERIPMSSYDVGNSAGNLHNKGLFFEMDGKVYFANAADNDCLYSMNTDETGLKRLTSMRTEYISGANGMLYFYMDSTKTSGTVTGLGAASNQYGIYRYKLKGGKQVCLLRDFCGELQLCGEYLYYQGKSDNGTLNKIKVDKSEKTKVADEMISPVCYYNGVIYYTGVTEDHRIHAMDTRNNDRVGDVLSGHLFNPVVTNGYLYYMNGDANYSLWRYNLLSGAMELVTSDRLDTYTMDGNYIYYAHADGNNSSLKRCELDGSNQVVLYQGVVNSLNLTSKYLYFKVFGNDDLYYHYPLNGSGGVSAFIG